MKEVTAVIRPHKLEDVVAAIEKVGQVGLHAWAVDGKGKQPTIEETGKGERFHAMFNRKILVRVVVPDRNAMEVVDAILQSAKTGAVGDGKIFVRSLDQAYRIRTGESGEDIL